MVEFGWISVVATRQYRFIYWNESHARLFNHKFMVSMVHGKIEYKIGQIGFLARVEGGNLRSTNVLCLRYFCISSEFSDKN